MFDVLVFVYENYWHGDASSELAHLAPKLNAVGFDADEIQEALAWLNALNMAASSLPPVTQLPVAVSSPHSMRIYTASEQDHLGTPCLGFISFLETAGALSPLLREFVIELAMAAPGYPVPLADLKIIVLMVFWRLGEQPDALVLDELSEVDPDRVAH